MKPEFAKAADPVFIRVLGLLERIDAGENPPLDDERVRIRGLLDQAEAMLGHGQEWQLAKYALVAWIDEVLIDAAWDGRDAWNENALEREIFGDRLAFDQFYMKAKEASALPRKDALEVYYIAAVLGFRGIYRDSVRHASEISELALPADLDGWAKQTSVAIQLGQGRPRIVDNSHPGDGAPALESKSLMVSYLLIGVILAAVNSIILSIVLMKTVWAS